MSLEYEANTSLAFNTTDFRQQGKKYGDVAEKLRTMATNLDNCLVELKDSGWTTPAGVAFQKAAEVNWEDNIEKYAALLDMLQEILNAAADDYDTLVEDHVELTQLNSGSSGGGGGRSF